MRSSNRFKVKDAHFIISRIIIHFKMLNLCRLVPLSYIKEDEVLTMLLGIVLVIVIDDCVGVVEVL